MQEIEEKLTLEECTKIIENCYEQKNIRVKSRSLVSLSNSVEGFLGQHFVVKIEHDEVENRKDQRFFMKILNGSLKTIFEISVSLNAYEREHFFYEHLFKDYEKYNLNTSFAPKQYFSKPYLFVLEDLSVRGFKPCAKNNFLDLDHCRIALNTLAQFHATYLLYEKEKTSELNAPYNLQQLYPKIFEDPFFCTSDNVAKTWLNYTLCGILALTEVLPENHVKNKDFSAKIVEFLSEAKKIKNDDGKNVVLHGDLWLNNFLFKYKDGVPIDGIIIDYQLIRTGPPALDVIHTIFDNTRKSFRDEHYEELLHFYYEKLEENLTNFDLDEILSKNTFLKLCEKFKIITKIFCLFDRSTTFMPEHITANFFSNDEDLHRFFFEDRVKLILEAYDSGGLFKELIEEDLLELRDMLFQ